MADVKIITSQKQAKELKFGDEFVIDIFPDPPEDDDADFEGKFQAALVRRDAIMRVVEETLSKQTPEPPGQVKKSISG